MVHDVTSRSSKQAEPWKRVPSRPKAARLGPIVAQAIELLLDLPTRVRGSTCFRFRVLLGGCWKEAKLNTVGGVDWGGVGWGEVG